MNNPTFVIDKVSKETGAFHFECDTVVRMTLAVQSCHHPDPQYVLCMRWLAIFSIHTSLGIPLTSHVFL